MQLDVRIRKVLWVALLAAHNVGVAAESRPPTAVAVDKVVALDSAPRTWTPGTVLSHTDSELGVEVAGLITWVADPGTLVKDGDAVARLDDELWRIAVEDSAAKVRGLEQRLVYLRSEADRISSLAEVNSAARSQQEESVSIRDVATEELVSAKAALERNRHKLSRTTVTAPFAGQIVERLVDPGEYMAVGQPAVRLVDLDNLEVRTQAPLRVAPFVREGLSLPMRSDAITVEGRVTAVIPVGNLESRSFEVRLALPTSDWVIGTPVKVGLPTSLVRRILTVPRDAMVLREAGPIVFRIQPDNMVERVEINTGIGAEDRIEVLGSALHAGDLVVVKGAEMLRDGQSVAY